MVDCEVPLLLSCSLNRPVADFWTLLYACEVCYLLAVVAVAVVVRTIDNSHPACGSTRAFERNRLWVGCNLLYH